MISIVLDFLTSFLETPWQIITGLLRSRDGRARFPSATWPRTTPNISPDFLIISCYIFGGA